jgi:hypothetical protein
MKVSLFITASLLFLSFWLSSCERKVEKGKYQFFFEMHDSIPYDAFDDNPFTADGKTLREPPKGTIPRGYKPYHYDKTPQDSERAGRELKNPFPRTHENLARGEELYKIFCIVCHGPTGGGDGPVAGKFPPPQSFQSDYMKALPQGRIYHTITHGSYLMGSYASQILPEDRWKLVLYVQALQRQPEFGEP